jgi:hypothetical protein
MANIVVSGEIEAPVGALWQLLLNFGEIGWMQGVTKVETTGEGVGMTRHIYAGGDTSINEVLESIDEAKQQIGYAIPENVPMPVTDYHATCTAVDLGDGRCRLDWGCSFEPDGVDEATAKANVEGMYGVLISWVKSSLEGA